MFSQQTFAVRPDLVIRPIRLGSRICWVVKDPIAKKFFYFNEQEHAILSWLDGTASVQTIVTKFCRQFTPIHLSAMQLSGFLAELARAELLQKTGRFQSESGPHSSIRKLRDIASNPLAIRLPGINPTRFLDALSPWSRWMFSTPALILAGLLIFAALICVMVRFEALGTAMMHLQGTETSRLLLTTAVVLIVVKIIHELAHALTARYFNARCESMGVLLLLFTPCLYCDVSDAWLLASRRARIAISAAGILVELVLAALATLLWMTTRDETARTLLLTVMLVCSVNTLLFNGNPLMRYDGYFILSDLLGIPNLAAEANAKIVSRMRQWIWGEIPPYLREEPVRQRVLLWIYGLLSTAYRLVLLVLILSGLYRVLAPAGLGIMVAGLGGLVLSALIFNAAKSIFRAPVGTLLTEPAHLRRPVLAGVALLAAILLLLFALPVPRRVEVPFRIESRAARDIFTPVAGELSWGVLPGQRVQAGERIAELKNPAIELELQKIDLQLASQKSRLKSLEARRGLLDHADERPALMESIAGLEKRRTVLVREQQGLTILSPRDGVVHEPPNVPPAPLESTSVSYWTGTPLETHNRQCHLPQGTHLCTILKDSEKEAVLYLGQKQVQRIRLGQTVRLWFPGIAAGQLRTHVVEIAPVPIEDIPRELLARNAIALNPAAPSGDRQPQEPVYRVTARFADPSVLLPLRSTGQASIRTASTSLWMLIRQLLRDSFTT